MGNLKSIQITPKALIPNSNYDKGNKNAYMCVCVCV